MKKQSCLIVLACLLAGCDPPVVEGAVNVPAADVAAKPTRAALVIGDPIHAWVPDLMDTVALGGPAGMAILEDRLFIAESTGHQVAVFDTTLDFRGRISRPGSGPGELENPRYLVATPEGELAVRDNGNARISIFSVDGRFRESLRTTPPATQFAALGADRFVVGSTFGDGPSLVVIDDNGADPFGPGIMGSIQELMWKAVVSGAAPDGDQIVVTLSSEGDLQALSPDGSLIAERAFPPDIEQAIHARNEDMQQAFPGSSSPYVKYLAPDPGRGLWILLPLKETPLIFFDFATMDWVAVETSPAVTTQYLLQNAITIDVVGDRLFVLTGEQLHVMPITRPEQD